MKQINILLLGAGGDIGQSIFKILKEIDWIKSIIGTDININSASKLIFDQFYQVPKCTHEDYISVISKISIDEKVTLILPVSEPEIRYFFHKGINFINGTPLVLVNSLTLFTALDKFKTVEFLKQHNLPYPITQQQDEQLILNFPIIAKSNTGSGSKSLILIEDELDLNYVKKKFPNHILQQFLPEDEGEYTCGLFRSSSGEIRHIVFKRDLMSGFSVFGQIIENDSIDQLLDKIAIGLNLKGSVNVQLRIVNGLPYVFEINPRFSSSVRFRDLFGFNDVLWVLEDQLNNRLSDYKKPLKNRKFYKGFNEFIL